MRCPHCHRLIADSRRRLDQERLAKGCCVDCGEPKTPEEIAAGVWRCRDCREVRRIKMRVARHGADADFWIEVA